MVEKKLSINKEKDDIPRLCWFSASTELPQWSLKYTPLCCYVPEITFLIFSVPVLVVSFLTIGMALLLAKIKGTLVRVSRECVFLSFVNIKRSLLELLLALNYSTNVCYIIQLECAREWNVYTHNYIYFNYIYIDIKLSHGTMILVSIDYNE